MAFNAEKIISTKGNDSWHDMIFANIAPNFFLFNTHPQVKKKKKNCKFRND